MHIHYVCAWAQNPEEGVGSPVILCEYWESNPNPLQG